MNALLQKLVNLYNTNAKFHAFVGTIAFAAVGFFSVYDGGVPTTKHAWVALGCGLAGAIYAGVKRWAQTNLATKGVELKPKDGDK